MEKKLNLKYPIIVEGRYDKAKVSLVVSSSIIALDGFSIFNNKEKQQLLKRISRKNGVIILTDSDRAGHFIRNKLKGILNGKVYNVYAPAIVGKEKRKIKASADGLLGVEGIDNNTLYDLLVPFNSDEVINRSNISNTRFYSDGFSGGNNSSQRRKLLAQFLELPETLTSKALLEAINLLVTEKEYENALKRINDGEENC